MDSRGKSNLPLTVLDVSYVSEVGHNCHAMLYLELACRYNYHHGYHQAVPAAATSDETWVLQSWTHTYLCEYTLQPLRRSTTAVSVSTCLEFVVVTLTPSEF